MLRVPCWRLFADLLFNAPFYRRLSFDDLVH
jgi:hypothetical protein